jgi:hypothetical protein
MGHKVMPWPALIYGLVDAFTGTMSGWVWVPMHTENVAFEGDDLRSMGPLVTISREPAKWWTRAANAR